MATTVSFDKGCTRLAGITGGGRSPLSRWRVIAPLPGEGAAHRLTSSNQGGIDIIAFAHKDRRFMAMTASSTFGHLRGIEQVPDHPRQSLQPQWVTDFRLIVDESVLVMPLTLAHVTELFAVLESNRSHLRQWLPWVDRVTDVAACAERVREWLDETARGVSVYNGIWNAHHLVGMLSYRRVDVCNRSTAIAYWLDEQATGKGMMTKSCRAAIGFAFGELDLNRVEIRCAHGNVQSQEVARRLGFRAEGVMRQGLRLRGVFVDLLLFALLRDEWAAQAAAL